MRVLDLGCGNGVISRAFASRGCDVTGIDPGDKSREHFEAQAASHEQGDLLRFFQAEGSRAAIRSYLDGGGEPFDLVISSQVIEHVYDPWDFAVACFDAARAGGRVVISTPYHGYLKVLLITARGRWDKTSHNPHRWHAHPVLQQSDARVADAGHRLCRAGISGIWSSPTALAEHGCRGQSPGLMASASRTVLRVERAPSTRAVRDRPLLGPGHAWCCGTCSVDPRECR